MKPEELTDVFLNEDYAKIYSQMSKTFQDEVALSQLQELGEEFNKGVTAFIFQSKLPYGDGNKRYIWTDASASKGIAAVFDNDDIVQGLQFAPLYNYHETDEIYTKTVFDVPFQDEWLVFWGGINSLVNYLRPLTVKQLKFIMRIRTLLGKEVPMNVKTASSDDSSLKANPWMISMKLW